MLDNFPEAQYLLVMSLGYAVLSRAMLQRPNGAQSVCIFEVFITDRIQGTSNRKKEILLQFSTLLTPCFTNLPSMGKELSTC